MGFGRLGGLARQVGLHAFGAGGAGALQRADAAGGLARGADRGAQIHHRLRMIAGPVGGRQAGGQARQFRLGAGQGASTREQARHHAFHIAIDHRAGSSKAIAATAAAV
jgi:hypothetical protein